GLSVLLCVAMNGWLGYRVRVALSRTRAAMVAAWDGDGWILVDPTRTRCNLLEAADYLMRVPTPTTCVSLRRNLLVEVRTGAKWQAGIVRHIDEARGQFAVDMIGSTRQLVCALNAHTWRRVTEDSSDLDRIVTRLVKRQRVSLSTDDASDAGA
ncbi:MAG: hypothetical protein VXX04_06025, partial [Actinomycetota bacterium]|nr:hypothetical protein [Actinomycetota bacterium]